MLRNQEESSGLLKDLMQESKEALNEEASSLFEVTANSQLRTGHAYLRRE